MAPPDAVGIDELAAVGFFGGVAGLEQLAPLLHRVEASSGTTVVRLGDAATSFAMIASGALLVTDADEEPMATAEAGSVIGELGLASGRPRRATVTAIADSVLFVGDRDAFEVLLGIGDARAHLQRIAATRLAAAAPSVPTTLVDGTDVFLRPLLVSDKAAYTDQIRQWSAESLRRRFFTSAKPSDHLIDYLVEIDYVNHFAWVVGDRSTPGVGLAAARYIRSSDEPEEAEIAFGVDEASRGRGIGTLLLGVLAVTAAMSGIDRFRAEVLTENHAMKAVLRKAGTEFRSADSDTVTGTLDVENARTLIADHLADGIMAAANELVTAAGIALVVSAEHD